MAAAMVSDEQKDEALTQFLSMTEDRVDPDVAQNLLEVVGWDVQAAVEHLYGGPVSPGQRRPTSDHMPPQGLQPSDSLEMVDGDRSRGLSGDDAELASEPMLVDEDVASVDLTASEVPVRSVAGGASAEAEQEAFGREATDAQLAAAIEASYQTETTAGRAANEEELIAQALRMSQQEEESRQRQNLREQQEQELAESIIMDQMREQREREERQAAEEAAKLADQARAEEESRLAQETEAKRSRLPPEPAAGEAGRLNLLLRLPGGQQRLQRAFRSTDAVGALYDYVDLQNPEVAAQRYRLVSTMPRRAYEDRQQSLGDAGIQNQFVLMVELSSGL